MKRKASEEVESVHHASEEIDQTYTLEQESDGWLSLEHGDQKLWVHPPTKRVCTSPEGDAIGQFDPDNGEILLFAEDAEAWGAVDMQRSDAASFCLAKHEKWSDEFASTGLVYFEGGSMLRAGLLEGVRTELEVMLAAGLFQPLRDQSCGKSRVAYLCTRAANSNEEVNEYAELMEARPCPPHCLEVISFLEGLAYVINGRFSLGLLCPRRCLAACYETGNYYTAHYDNLVNPETGARSNGRALTAILYVNDVDWPVEHGGQLRCHVAGGPADTCSEAPPTRRIVDISPAGGQIVLFDSCRLLHEVLPTSKRRLVLQLWFVVV